MPETCGNWLCLVNNAIYYAGLDTYFFPNLGVGQPSNNTDLSEIEIYLGMIIIFFVAMKKYKNRGEIWSYVSLLLFQDSLELVLFIFVHFDRYQEYIQRI